MSTPRFSIIVPHYQPSISHEIFCRGISSLKTQYAEHGGVEILRYHDGPLTDPEVDWPVNVTCTKQRHDDWGHSLRDIGIWEASGEYVLHFKPDNILYPHALSRLSEVGGDVIVFPVRMMGMRRSWLPFGLPYVYNNPRDYSRSVTLSGRPARRHRIDCMQWVMKTALWREEGGWREKQYTSDGTQYERFAQKYPVTYIDGPPLGEHW